MTGMNEIQAHPGERIDIACRRLAEAAPAFMVFNGTRVEAEPGDTAEVLCERWSDQRDRASKFCRCPCGYDLAGGIKCGIWTLANIACEYRTCTKCQATRPYRPARTVPGRHIHLYLDPETSEVSGEWDDLLEAIANGPPSPLAELRRNGIVLARTYCGIDEVHGWFVMPPEIEL